MGLVVQKYGGSSVADAESVKRVAARIVDTKKAGHDVVVIVSAMGDTTDDLIDLAERVSPKTASPCANQRRATRPPKYPHPTTNFATIALSYHRYL